MIVAFVMFAVGVWIVVDSHYYALKLSMFGISLITFGSGAIIMKLIS